MQPESQQPRAPKLVTAKELAEMFSVSERTVRRMESEGAPMVRIGRSTRFDPDAVYRWLVEASHEVRL